jgi:WD40 repeat protein
MAQVRRHCHAVAVAVVVWSMSVLAPARAQDHGQGGVPELFERPVLAVDPRMHTAAIQAVDTTGQFAVTGGPDRTVRIWSVADGKLLRTIWMPLGPGPVGIVNSVEISPDESTIAAGGASLLYLLKRESGNLIQSIGGDAPGIASLKFSPDGRFLAVGLFDAQGLRVLDRDKDWSEVFRDDQYEGPVWRATFTRDGRLVTASDESLSLGGFLRYRYDSDNEHPNFRLVGQPVRQPSSPRDVAFSPDGKQLAVGFWAAAVDILDGFTLEPVSRHRPTDVEGAAFGFIEVAWSRDGRTLFAAGGVIDAQLQRRLFAWDRAGVGDERRMIYCDNSSATAISVLPNEQILLGSKSPCLGLMDTRGNAVWTVTSPVLSLRGADNVHVSEDAEVVDFAESSGFTPGFMMRFDVRSLTLSSPPPRDGTTIAPRREGLTIVDWENRNHPTLNGRVLPIGWEMSRSLAIAPDAKRFFLGSHAMLRAFDDAGTEIWSYDGRGEVWAVNASKDGRIVVAAYSDGTIRWHRAVDGHELLALQVLRNNDDPAKWDWVLWTPEGFYEATQGAQDVLKWVVNHGPDKATTTLPVSAIPKLHRRNTLPLVLEQLETARAIGIEEITEARLDVQAKAGSAQPPGGVLHVLAIGVDKFGEKASDLHLDYAVKDAHDVATTLLESQKGGPAKPSLYADVDLKYLHNDKADSAAILDELDAMARSVAKNETGQDVAVILVASHGEIIDGQFYLIPYGFDAGSQGRSIKSAVSAAEFAKKVASIAAHAKVLLLLDTCHSGAVGAQGWAQDPNAKVLQDAMDLENVTVLTSSKRDELSEELPEWEHGALAEAFLGALRGAADSKGIIKILALTDAMETEIQSLTKGRQHLGIHMNFTGDLFVASRY